MNHLKKIGLILTCFFIFSCEREVEISIDPPEPSAVLNASLSADSIIMATISRTVSNMYYDIPEHGPSYFLDEAQIEVFINDKKQGVMEKGENPGQYRLPGYSPSAGDNVRMEVQTGDFKPLSAEVLIPSQPEILSVDTQMYHTHPDSYYGRINSINVGLRFKETREGTNYYMLAVSGYGVSKNKTPEETNTFVFITHDDDMLFEELQPSYFSGYNQYAPVFIFSNRSVDSGEYTLKFTINNVFTSYYDDSLSFTSICRVYLYSISESYYLYCRSKLLQWKQKEDPFGSIGLREPIPTYTNVRNGYGLLSAKQVAIYELKVAPGDIPPSEYYTY